MAKRKKIDKRDEMLSELALVYRTDGIDGMIPRLVEYNIEHNNHIILVEDVTKRYDTIFFLAIEDQLVEKDFKYYQSLVDKYNIKLNWPTHKDIMLWRLTEDLGDDCEG